MKHVAKTLNRKGPVVECEGGWRTSSFYPASIVTYTFSSQNKKQQYPMFLQAGNENVEWCFETGRGERMVSTKRNGTPCPINI
jgi:hypothetical protein